MTEPNPTRAEVAAALADVCGYHEGDACTHCAEVLDIHRERGWTDTQVLADIELYRTDFRTWAIKVRERADVRAAARARLAAKSEKHLMRYLQRRRQQADLIIIGALTDGELPGHPLMQRTGLGPGRLYDALRRLEDAGRITSDWADGPRPRRRVYRLARTEVA